MIVSLVNGSKHVIKYKLRFILLGPAMLLSSTGLWLLDNVLLFWLKIALNNIMSEINYISFSIVFLVRSFFCIIQILLMRLVCFLCGQ